MYLPKHRLMQRLTKIKAFIYLSTILLLSSFFIATGVSGASVSDIPSSFTFTKTLAPNKSYDPDVKYLQLVLNSNSQTIVSLTGPGSNDMPTSFYGNKTKDAVNRFQMLYKDEILTPAGLTTPTGIVGANTRAKLNSILSSIRSGSIESNIENSIDTETIQTSDQTSDQNDVQTSATSSTSTSSSGYVFVIDGSSDTDTTEGGASSGQSQQSTSNTASNASTSSSNNTNSSNGGGSNNSSSGAAAGAVSGIAGGLTSAFGGSGSSVSGGGTQYFGGRITNVTYCTCSASILLDIQDTLRGYVSVLYTPGVSRLYANYQVFTTGPNVIGGYTSGGTCQVYSGTQCNSQGSPMGTINTIHGIGTSLR